MAKELAFVLINPYTVSKSRTGGVIARYISRTGLDFVAARMFAPSVELARSYAQLIRGDLEIDPASRTLKQAGRKVEISPREFAVLWALLQVRGRVLSRPQIEEHLYSWGDTVESNAVEVYVHGLRIKLGAHPVLNVRGLGYMVPR